MEERIFVAIARFPDIPTEREEEFREWFAWSNDQLREIDGLKGRRLLRSPDGTYTALVEHKSAETFAAMHSTEVASKVHARLGRVIIDEPRAIPLGLRMARAARHVSVDPAGGCRSSGTAC